MYPEKIGFNRVSSSMYALSIKRAKSNLNSALLWHRRLRNISKKRIKKLQHDRLLNSAELKAFEKCIPYMSGKIARKPYTHQVKRAKDLLRLIHTDDHRIITHRTPPYTPQHNGVLERRNRTLLDLVRSLMSQATLPKSCWNYALKTVARILNMVPTKKVEKTPYKNLSRLLDSQQSDKSKIGLGYDSQGVDNQVLENQVNDKNNTCEGYHAVPPPYIGNFMPPKPDLVFDDENVVSESITSLPDIAKSKVKTSKTKLKNVSASMIKDWVSDSEDENEIETEFK
nr:retrotransposon protein, putative, Ty1-copia subclass [Tanacetum cinerariifolium]